MSQQYKKLPQNTISVLTVTNGAGDKPMVEVKISDETKRFAPEEISAMVSLSVHSFSQMGSLA
jgi:molecular chaperone DnaK (HSP70)